MSINRIHLAHIAVNSRTISCYVNGTTSASCQHVPRYDFARFPRCSIIRCAAIITRIERNDPHKSYIGNIRSVHISNNKCLNNQGFNRIFIATEYYRNNVRIENDNFLFLFYPYLKRIRFCN